jgi:uncharacterized protein YndB with AHSA1/START domain
MMDGEPMLNTNSAMTTTVGERDVVLERTFDASRQQVFEAFTDPEKVVKWWGPKGWITEVYKMDVKPGGTWHYCMRGPENKESWGKAVYHEVKAPERLKYTDSFADAEGNTVKGMPETIVTVDFVDFEGKTRLMSRADFASTADLENVLAMGMVQGIDETWDRLASYLDETSLHPSM